MTTPPPPAQAAAPASPEVEKELQTLQYELVGEDRDKALARISHYRPLCDRAGYPLVGNVIRKGGPAGFQPSALCAEVRRRGAH